MKDVISHSVEETNKIATDWLREISTAISTNTNNGAVIVGLNGNLGSGKTTFTQAVAKALGVKGNITSPTFVLMKIYEISSIAGSSKKDISRYPFKKLIHIDAYRLEHGEELGALNFKELATDSANLVLIEWAENVRTGLPDKIQNIRFEHISESERRLTFV